jgi:hypothetical protein
MERASRKGLANAKTWALAATSFHVAILPEAPVVVCRIISQGNSRAPISTLFALHVNRRLTVLPRHVVCVCRWCELFQMIETCANDLTIGGQVCSLDTCCALPVCTYRGVC